MKMLSFKIENGRPVVTGDQAKHSLVVADKHFMLPEAKAIDVSTYEKRLAFLIELLQDNHEFFYHFEDNVLTVDDIEYIFKDKIIVSVNNGNEFIVPTWEKRNLFKIYEDFYRFHHGIIQTHTLYGFINAILAEKDMRKEVSHVDERITGQLITVSDTHYNSSLTPDFQLHLDTNNNLTFLHFLDAEQDYGYYEGGNPISRESLVRKIAKAQQRLDLHDQFVEFFKRTMKL